MSGLPEIPFVDMRDGGPVRHAREVPARALMVRDACFGFFPPPLAGSIALLDTIARRWLERSQSPYVAEVEAVARNLGVAGVWFLNASYQWGCTALARDDGDAPWLVRTLDWPFPGLGRYAEVANVDGPAGAFLNVTWPGYVGTLSAMAPSRFAATVNQAPMFRRAMHPWLRLYDMTANAVGTYWRVRFMPPDHLLRLVFETCRNFTAAREMLERTPVARPVIFTLAGAAAGERCVIERTEETFDTRFDATVAANDWHRPRPQWEGRIAARHFFNLPFAGAAENSRLRSEALTNWRGEPDAADFPWLVPPVLNIYTRIAIVMRPGHGLLQVGGYEAPAPGLLPAPATAVRRLQLQAKTPPGA
ncbi:MAG: hypothetical protein J0H62_07215 [Rhizobiales bacterium]|nr:hypothetical protein [Hyphomicrobiales bacterium]